MSSISVYTRAKPRSTQSRPTSPNRHPNQRSSQRNTNHIANVHAPSPLLIQLLIRRREHKHPGDASSRSR